MDYHPSWNEDAKLHFEKAIKAHGGWDAWNNLTTLEFKLEKFSGGLMLAKGLNRSFKNPLLVKVSPHKKQVDFKYPTHTDTYLNGKITYSIDQKVIEDGKSIFKRKTFERWFPPHATYFFGYAWINYLSYPFILPPFELIDYKITNTNSYFTIKFPCDHHTHCEIQTFYFNRHHLLFRHDYKAILAGPFVYGAHYTEDYQELNGIKFACTRKVKAKLAGIILPINGIYGKINI